MITVAPQVNQAKSAAKLDLDNLTAEQTALEIKNLDLYYGDKQALSGVNMNIPKGQVTAFIGPSGCGKSTLLRCINRMNDLVDSCRIEGE
ncbi:MAG: ATP-binding cassette domain-containing protein, partial [Pseudomonadota bacterium]